MKDISNILFSILFLFMTSPSKAQCDSEPFLDNCTSTINEFRFLKHYKFRTKDDEKLGEPRVYGYSYVFSKGSTYVLTACYDDSEGNKMIVSLYDSNRKLISSSYDKKTGKLYPTIKFKCSSTGIYYFTFNFEKEEGGCGVSILGFNKSN